jgi:hypothetical protein
MGTAHSQACQFDPLSIEGFELFDKLIMRSTVERCQEWIFLETPIQDRK